MNTSLDTVGGILIFTISSGAVICLAMYVLGMLGGLLPKEYTKDEIEYWIKLSKSKKIILADIDSRLSFIVDGTPNEYFVVDSYANENKTEFYIWLGSSEKEAECVIAVKCEYELHTCVAWKTLTPSTTVRLQIDRRRFSYDYIRYIMVWAENDSCLDNTEHVWFDFDYFKSNVNGVYIGYEINSEDIKGA